MFLAHYAVGLATKRVAPRVSLGTALMAAQLADLLWPSFLLAGAEVVRVAPGITAVTPLDFVSYPYSHSALAVAAWAVVFGGTFLLVRRRVVDSLVLAVLVCSHWLLDVLAHRADLQILPWMAKRVGMGLWFSTPATVLVEGVLLAGGALLYARATRPRDRTGRLGFVAMLAVLLLVYVGAVFGPPPPNTMALAWSGQALWLFVAWGYGLERHREARPASSQDLSRT
jgi:hypothetical protein